LTIYNADKNVFDVNRVPGRRLIQIHIGNNEDDVSGCILPGLQYGYVKALSGTESKPGVLYSRAAFNKLKSLMGDKSFWLEIIRGGLYK
jgi:hypothetical protein